MFKCIKSSTEFNNQYCTKFNIGDKVRFYHGGNQYSSEIGNIVGYDDDGFYVIEWSDHTISEGISDYNLKGLRTNSLVSSDNTVCADNRYKDVITSTSLRRYDCRSTIKYNKHNYSVYYTEVDDRPEASAKVMFDDFEFQITRLSPYDNAEYAWCSGSQGKVRIYRNNKLIGTSFYMDSDDMGVENYEWCDEVIFQCITMLEKYNHSIEPKIIHNSIKSKCKQKPIKASSNNMIKALNDQLYTKASQYLKNNLGWSLKDISDMLFIDISKIDANRYRIEVRAELDYDWMFDLVKTLDHIVQRYDKGAYFDMVEPGISEAFINLDR